MIFSALVTAQRLAAAGLSVIPIRADGSKAPAVGNSWKPYQEHIASDTELRHWFAGIRGGLAVIGGAVSGGQDGYGLEILDFDAPGLYEEWAALCEDQGLGELLASLPLAATGGGGRHLYYRAPGVPGNTKLAERWSEDKNRAEVLIETRGEGGYAVIPPSPPACHPSGRPYEYLRGDLADVPRITAGERDELVSLARALNEWYAPEQVTKSPAKGSDKAAQERTGLSPGDDYNARGSWDALLTEFGMTRKRVRGETEYWGWADNGRAVCATVNHADSGLFYNWSTAAHPFEAERAYDLFGAYARLRHGGDFAGAAKALAGEGYGDALKRSAPSHFYAPPLSDADAPPPRGGTASGTDADPPLDFPFTDLGNARRLVARWGKDIRFCHAGKQWFLWDGRRWSLDGTGGIHRAARETIQDIKAQADALGDTDRANTLRAWAHKCESYNRLTAMVTLAQHEPGVPARVEELDQHPMLLTVQNGTLDLTTGALRPHRRGDLITKLAPVQYDPDAACPRWDKFLDRILAGDADLIGFVARALGFALTGDTRRRVMVILHGNQGRNGKSTLIDTIHTMLGDYALNTAAETLMVKRNETSNTSDIARLRGARFVAARESEEGQRLSEGLVKQMTGGDVMTARFMYEDFFDFKPEFKLFLATNHAPNTRATDEGFWDRIRLVPFNVRIPDDEVDPKLPEKLLDEMPGILAWCVRGCLAWAAQGGVGNTQAVASATDSYRTENDALGLFLETCCVLLPSAKTPAAQLYKAYEAWCVDNGQYCQKQAAFGRKLSERNILPDKGSGGVVSRIGIGLTVDVSE